MSSNVVEDFNILESHVGSGNDTLECHSPCIYKLWWCFPAGSSCVALVLLQGAHMCAGGGGGGEREPGEGHKHMLVVR